MAEEGIKVTVKSYLFTIGHRGESQVELAAGGRRVRDLLDKVAQQQPALAPALKEGIGEPGREAILVLRNGDKVNDLDTTLQDGDKVVLLDGAFGG
ncbi:MAG: MoaD/ThiS family protein [Bacillota bacterium]